MSPWHHLAERPPSAGSPDNSRLMSNRLASAPSAAKEAEQGTPNRSKSSGQPPRRRLWTSDAPVALATGMSDEESGRPRGCALPRQRRPAGLTPGRPPLQRDLETHPFHLQQRLGVALGVVDRVVGMRRLPQMLEILERVLDQALVERAEIGAAVSE